MNLQVLSLDKIATLQKLQDKLQSVRFFLAICLSPQKLHKTVILFQNELFSFIKILWCRDPSYKHDEQQVVYVKFDKYVISLELWEKF